jgi:hypothetical protein
MRSFFTAIAFLIILFAVIPAVRRSLYANQKPDAANPEDRHEG